MTNEEKDILLKDLCGRLPYGVKCTTNSSRWTDSYTITGYNNNEFYINCPIYNKGDNEWLIEFIVPYLRPLSSMTDEEEEEYKKVIETLKWTEEFDFYNKYHFDYRGLIPMGLALEAPEDMYK